MTSRRLNAPGDAGRDLRCIRCLCATARELRCVRVRDVTLGGIRVMLVYSDEQISLFLGVVSWQVVIVCHGVENAIGCLVVSSASRVHLGFLACSRPTSLGISCEILRKYRGNCMEEIYGDLVPYSAAFSSGTVPLMRGTRLKLPVSSRASGVSRMKMPSTRGAHAECASLGLCRRGNETG